MYSRYILHFVLAKQIHGITHLCMLYVHSSRAHTGMIPVFWGLSNTSKRQNLGTFSSILTLFQSVACHISKVIMDSFNICNIPRANASINNGM